MKSDINQNACVQTLSNPATDQTLTKVGLSKTQCKNRIDKIIETDPSSFWQDAEQLQDWQDFRNRPQCVWHVAEQEQNRQNF